ncbi:DUF4097 family beta strand repeat-containing protein [Emticicia sp. BO119]|uniref:DUF4097 family beta strand repeat-containing protein n=1 Tax=Emticicia sp. BO119 TaxID=2757768 RepID=UPI0015F07CDC|nr:DUF4097 family beta strand repeat-containing protein [Emticicia sp. BO119]MBA4849822.1 DUF4097 family beta strand repeat protein [Emticicia sp. BO119]
MKKVFVVVLVCMAYATSFGQTKPYKVAFSGQGKKVQVVIQQASVNIQGVDGNEVTIEQTGENRKELPKEAEGLRLVTGGVVDNTGVGASAEVEGNILKILIPKNRYTGVLTIKVPKSLDLTVIESQNWNEQKIIISDIAGEIELKTNNSRAYLNDITGPLVANTGHGKIFVTYSKLSQSSPSSISASGAIDITLPNDAKANLKVRSYYGDLFTDWDITAIKKENKSVASSGTKTIAGQGESSSDVALTTKAKVFRERGADDSDERDIFKRDQFVYVASSGKGGDAFEGTINGGGVVMDLKSSNGNIYIRKKK